MLLGYDKIKENTDKFFDYFVCGYQDGVCKQRSFFKKRDEKGITYITEVPGYGKEDFSASVLNSKTISFVVKEKENVLYTMKDFNLTIMDTTFDITKTKITVENGILTVFVPLKESEKEVCVDLKIE